MMVTKEKGNRTEMGLKQMIIAAIMILFVVAPASAATLTVTPDSTTSGALVTIEGTGFGANEEVNITSTVTDFKIPVSGTDGRYAYSLVDFNISQENTSFSLSVREVEDDMILKVKRFWWTPYWTIDENGELGFTFTRDDTTNTSTVTRGMPTPTGVYCVVTVTGTAVAAPTATGYVQNVTLNATVTKKVMTNDTGGFKEVIDTHGIPAGNYTINATNSTVYAEATLMLSLCGDANKDGDVGAYDCVCIARCVAEIPGYCDKVNDEYTSDTLNLAAADVDGEAGVTIDDARYLARYLVGLETELHCPED